MGTHAASIKKNRTTMDTLDISLSSWLNQRLSAAPLASLDRDDLDLVVEMPSGQILDFDEVCDPELFEQARFMLNEDISLEAVGDLITEFYTSSGYAVEQRFESSLGVLSEIIRIAVSWSFEQPEILSVTVIGAFIES